MTVRIHPDPPTLLEARIDAHRTVSDLLSRQSDDELAALLPASASETLSIGDMRVFVKRIPLCDLERQAENVRSTANLFALPTFYPYAVGSSGFGAWRELAAHEIANEWVLGGTCTAFPLLHHWRVMNTAPPMFSAEIIDQLVANWAGSAAVRARLEALATARASLVLFLEYVPHTLYEWLAAQVALGDAAVASATSMVEAGIESTTAFLRANDFVHFDAHFANILTDGERLFFADLGLASSRRFALSADEQEFIARHASYDRALAMSEWVHHLAEAGPAAAAACERHSKTAAIMRDFIREIREDNKLAQFPEAEVVRTGAGLTG